jgi:hypothetical protein
MKKYFLFFLIILSVILAFPVYAETLVNSGFIPGQIWYSKAALVDGDTINIHTAIWNGEKDSISAKFLSRGKLRPGIMLSRQKLSHRLPLFPE